MQWARVADISPAAIARKYLEALARLVDDVAASAEAFHGSGNDEGVPS